MNSGIALWDLRLHSCLMSVIEGEDGSIEGLSIDGEIEDASDLSMCSEELILTGQLRNEINAAVAKLKEIRFRMKFQYTSKPRREKDVPGDDNVDARYVGRVEYFKCLTKV